MSEAQKNVYEERCTECGAVDSLTFRNTEGTKVCTKCGVVQEMNMIDQSLEHRNYTSELGGSNSESNRVNHTVNNRWTSDQVPDTVIKGKIINQYGKSIDSHHYDHELTKNRNIRIGHKKINELAGMLNLRHGNVVD